MVTTPFECIAGMPQMLVDAEGIFHRAQQRKMIIRRGILHAARPMIGDDDGGDAAAARK